MQSIFILLATEAVHFQNTKGIARNMNAPLELIASDVLDHYRTYSLLERLLYTPTKLSEQPSFQLEPQSQHLLIEKSVFNDFSKLLFIEVNVSFFQFISNTDTITWTIQWLVKYSAKSYHLDIEKIWMK